VSRLFLGLLVALVVALSAASGSPAAAPKRIVSLSATATESLFAIGAGKQVIAVDDQSDYPATAPHTSLSGFTPNVEAIAGYRPDLVVVAYDPNGLVGTLRGLGIRVVVQDAAKTLDEAYAQIRRLGSLTGHEKQAVAVVARMQKRIGELLAKSTRRARGLTVYHELEPDLYSATSKTFIGQIYSKFGL
jgi:iron complex transport system substrate-binding protein